jgi:predicted unusual protein kinase regulating ubiquinone biosynthesis (AarF/ABC1/UbiB family)
VDARAAALAEELGSQLARMKGAGPKLKQFLSMVVLDPPEKAGRLAAPGATPEVVRAVPLGRVQQVIEQDLGTRVGRVFEDIEAAPFALASLGQVHRARTTDGERVAVKVQHPGVGGGPRGGPPPPPRGRACQP